MLHKLAPENGAPGGEDNRGKRKKEKVKSKVGKILCSWISVFFLSTAINFRGWLIFSNRKWKMLICPLNGVQAILCGVLYAVTTPLFDTEILQFVL